MQSEIFVGKTADDVKRFLNMCPIDVVYKESSIQKHLLKEEEPVFYDAPTIRLKPGCHLYFANAEEQMINVFSSIQYQIKQKTEETE